MRTRLRCNITVIGLGAVALGLVGVWLFPQRPATAGVGALPEDTGLAAKYPGDAGIERDPAVVFAENFETGTIEEIGKRWGDISNKGGKVLAFTGDVPMGSSGKRALQMTATAGENQGGYLYARLARGVDTAFARFYVKFTPDHFAYPCGLHLGGYNPPTAWPQGNPGRPRGDDRMMVEFGPVSESEKHAAPGVWGISCFWPEMRISADGHYWGNLLCPARPAPVASDHWQCVEVMLKSNSAPDKSDGELALWLDGKLAMHIKPGVRRGHWSGMGFTLVEQGGEPFEGFRWRTTNDLKINFFWLLYNVVNANPASPVARVWYDDIVVATQYIGPSAKEGKAAHQAMEKPHEKAPTTTEAQPAVLLEPLPEGNTGISAKYAGDRGIERDPAVLFAEDFETGGLEDLGERWSEISNKDGKVLAFSDDVPAATGGKRSLQMTGTLGENSGGHLHTTFPGVDQAYLRFYTKFAADHAYEHHFVELGGYNPPTRWPNPRAGTRPVGNERLMVFIDPIGWYGKYLPPGIWSLYTYWPEMKVSADGKFWGNCINPAQPQNVPRDQWQCVELMVKMNSAPDKADGELALWLDGKLAMHVLKGVPRGPWSGMGFDVLTTGGEPFEGLRLRTSDDLKINHLWLEHYVDEGAQRQNRLDNPTRVNRVWFDDVVVSVAYIGPIQKRNPGGKNKP